ncbi:hypothetical protein [uncultured Campylobacter sp.]|uniref:hypothetical protein n=1 Tax=uncultured Campylobacter sp. TaxID=218934 RepID=UPI002625F197|nr:hypothetical protein [uncultured Campylobacter sp.]
MNRRFLLIYCALNAALTLLGLALCGAGFFGSGSFGVRALAWLLSLEAGFLGAFGAVYFSFRAYRNKIEDELRAGKYDEILRQSPKNSTGFMNGKTSANDTNSASFGGENLGGASSGDEISYGKICGNEILKSKSFSDLNSGAEILNAQNSKGAVNFTSGETSTENDDSHALYDETSAERAASSADINFTRGSNLDAEYGRAAAGECDVNSTKSDDKTSACGVTALGRAAADKFNMKDCATCDNSHGGINDEASDSSQGDIGARCDDLKSGAGSNLDDDVDSGGLGDGADRNNHSDGADSGNRGGDVDSSEPGDDTSDFGGGISGARDGSKDDFEGADDSIDGWDDERKRGEVRSNFAEAFFSPFKILSYAALVTAIYLLAKLSLLNPLAIILGVTIIPLGTMIVAFADKDAH